MDRKLSTFRAFKSDRYGKWGVEDLYGAILYEAEFNSEGVASYVALRHTKDAKLTWEDIQADVEKLEREHADSMAAAPVAEFSQSEFERGWDAATFSVLDIVERALDIPVGDPLTHLKLLLENFRKTYPKHGQRVESASGASAGEGE
jgi:hypothetical protein